MQSVDLLLIVFADFLLRMRGGGWIAEAVGVAVR